MAKTIVLDPNFLLPGIVTDFPNRGSAGGTFKSTGTGATRPVCQRGGLNSLNNELQFDGVSQYLPSTLVGTNVITAAAFTVLAVCFVGSISADAAQPYDNDAVLVGVSEYWGMHLSNDPNLIAFVFTGGVAKKAEVALTLNAWQLLQIRLLGGNLYARAGSAAESAPTVCGNVQDITGALRLGRNYNTNYGMFRLGCLECYNTGDADGDLAGARARLARKYGIAA